MDMVVEAEVEVFDVYDIGFNQNKVEKLRIEASGDLEYNNLKVEYVGYYLNCFLR